MYKLQYISQGQSVEEHLSNCKNVLEGGCKWIQLRMKNFEEQQVERTAIEVQNMCSEHGAKFILNDNVHLASRINADGVHLGLSDMSIQEAREIVGYDKIIGGTANTLKDVIQRIDEGCDYIGLGPYRYTTTKDKLSPVLGIEGYSNILSQLTEQQKQIPIVAIGGIETHDIPAILESGVSGIALSGLLTTALDKKEIIQNINTKLYESV
jgi:thiamine-phosphate pyrophosphorylase